LFLLAAFCRAQSASESQPFNQTLPQQTPSASQSASEAGQAAQPDSGGCAVPQTEDQQKGQQEKPGDEPSAPSNPQGQTGPAPADAKKTEDTKKKDMDRMFYIMPNYLTVDNASQAPPITWKDKFSMAVKGSFDPYEFVIVGVVAGIRQAENSSDEFGQGAQGYFKRYGAAFADQVDGNIMTGGVFPTILKTDPRYYRLGRGSFGKRFGYAISRIAVTRKDSGGSMFNISEFAGNATAIAISLAYYPASDRSFSGSVSSWGTQMGIDAFGNELKEFWPDVHRYIEKRQARHREKNANK